MKHATEALRDRAATWCSLLAFDRRHDWTVKLVVVTSTSGTAAVTVAGGELDDGPALRVAWRALQIAIRRRPRSPRHHHWAEAEALLRTKQVRINRRIGR